MIQNSACGTYDDLEISREACSHQVLTNRVASERLLAKQFALAQRRAEADRDNCRVGIAL